jgi:hypothetical protein
VYFCLFQVAKFDDPHEACLSVVAESYRLWLQYETRTDDITMIMLQLTGLDQPPPSSNLSRCVLQLMGLFAVVGYGCVCRWSASNWWPAAGLLKMLQYEIPTDAAADRT